MEQVIQTFIIGLSNGLIFALVALGYTMVYGIIELINFAHGDLFMLGTFMGLTVLSVLGISVSTSAGTGTGLTILAVLLMLLVVPAFCAGLTWSLDRLVYQRCCHCP